MGTSAGAGFSRNRNPKVAAKEAAEQAMKSAGVDRPDFVFLFATAAYEQEPLLKTVREVTGGAPLSGCSGEGVIATGAVNESAYAVSVMAIKSDTVRFQNAIASGLPDSAAAGKELAARLAPHIGADARAVFVFPDGMFLNYKELVRGWDEGAPSASNLPMLGGASADGMVFQKTYQYCDDQVLSAAVAGVLLSGDATVVSGIDSGCAPPVGAPNVITKIKGNVIQEIGGQRATDWFKDYTSRHDLLEKWNMATQLMFALAFKAEDERKLMDDFYVTGISGKDDEAGSVTIYTEVPEGTRFWLTSRDPDRMRRGVDRLAGEIRKDLAGKTPKMVLQFDCAGRGKFALPEEEAGKLVLQLQDKIGSGIPWAGFYTYGEIAPVLGHRHSHNYTVVLAAIF